MRAKRFTLDGLLSAVSKGVRLADLKPLPAIGAGVSRAKKARIPKAQRYAGFPAFCVRSGLPEPVAEFRFHPERKWRFDFCFTEARVYVEVQGGLFSNGRHTRGAALLAEYEKITAATTLGYRPIFLQPSDLMTAKTIQSIRSAIAFSNNQKTI